MELTPVDGDPFAGFGTLIPVDGDPFGASAYAMARRPIVPPVQPAIGQAGGAPLDDFTPAPQLSGQQSPPGWLARLAGDPSRSMAVRVPAAVGSSLAYQAMGLAHSAWGAATLPGDVAKGKVDPNSAEAIHRSADLAGLLTSPSAGTAVSDPAKLGIFAGARAGQADISALSKAKSLVAQGADRSAIWDQTGWFTGADGQWRFEIPDVGSAVKSGSSPSNLADALVHLDLYQAYPDMRKMQVEPTTPEGYHGLYYPPFEGESDLMAIDRSGALSPSEELSAFLHEAQHGVQEREGFSGATDDRSLGLEDYFRSPGEVEARNVQARMDMSPAERRANPPWLEPVDGDPFAQ